MLPKILTRTAKNSHLPIQNVTTLNLWFSAGSAQSSHGSKTKALKLPRCANLGSSCAQYDPHWLGKLSPAICSCQCRCKDLTADKEQALLSWMFRMKLTCFTSSASKQYYGACIWCRPTNILICSPTEIESSNFLRRPCPTSVPFNLFKNIDSSIASI